MLRKRRDVVKDGVAPDSCTEGEELAGWEEEEEKGGERG